MPDVTFDWEPQPKQAVALKAAGLLPVLDGGKPTAPVARILGYGGAAGGGKSDVLCASAILWALTFPGAHAAYFRRTYADLEGPDGAVMRSHELMAEARLYGLADWNGEKHRWTFINGSTWTFCHCQREKDKFNYQSSRFDLLLFDEVTHFTFSIVDYLLTRNGPTVDSVINPLCMMATNPGGTGHIWFREWFVDRQPWMQRHEVVRNKFGKKESVYFIPAKLEDNPILDQRAGGAYRETLEARDDDTRRALLDADWDVFVGQYFKTFNRARHVIEPVDIPAHWPRFSGTDWGFSAPFATLWVAQNPDSGRVYVYRELYETELTDRDQARLYRSVTPEGEKIRARYADPSMWTKDKDEQRTVSGYDIYKSEGVLLTKADNDRVNGWKRLRTFLQDLPDGKPGLLIFETCENLIRTLGSLPYAGNGSEDLDSDAEDHAADALRYALTSIKPLPSNRTPAAAAEAKAEKIGKAGRVGGARGGLTGKDF